MPKERAAGLRGWFFVIFSAVIIIMGWIFAAFVLAVGRFLAKRKHYLFCLAMAGIECIFMPFGTVLGVFTIMVLVRDSVKQLFNANTTLLATAAHGSSRKRKTPRRCLKLLPPSTRSNP